MEIRKANYDDYEELVEMYYALIHDVYPERKKAPKMYFFQQVINWFQPYFHIRIATKNDTIMGFTLCSFDNSNGVTETIYHADISYIKPEYRKTRAAFLLYMDIVHWAIDNNYVLQTASIPETGADKLIAKRFNSKLRFSTYSQRPEILKEWLDKKPSKRINKIDF